MSSLIDKILLLNVNMITLEFVRLQFTGKI